MLTKLTGLLAGFLLCTSEALAQCLPYDSAVSVLVEKLEMQRLEASAADGPRVEVWRSADKRRLVILGIPEAGVACILVAADGVEPAEPVEPGRGA